MTASETPRARDSVGFVRALGFLCRYWRRLPWLFVGISLALAITLGCEIMLPVASGRLVGAVAHLPSHSALVHAVAALAIFLSLQVAAETCRLFNNFMWVRVATTVMPRMMHDAFDRVQRFSTDWHASTFAGATVRRITRGMWAYDTLADVLMFGLVPSAIMLVGLSVMLMLHWMAIGCAFAIAVATYVGVSVALATRWVAPANEAFAQQDSDLGGLVADAVSCNSVVQSFASEEREAERLGAMAKIWQFKARRAWNRGTIVAGIQSALNAVMLMTLLGLGLWLWQSGDLTVGEMTLIITTYFMVQGYIRQVGQQVRQAQGAVNDIADMVVYCDMPVGIPDRPGARPLEVGHGEIRFDRVKFHYGNRPDPLFEDLNVVIRPGEKVALVGKSGSGKSTFVRLIQRLYEVIDGRLLIDGQNVADVTLDSLRRAIALVPQDPILFHRTLAENIGYAKPDATRAEIELAARRAHADEFISGLVHGYDTMVGERGVKLSGGERQRVAIARAFLADAPIVIMDEATSSLDSVTEALIQDSLQHLMEGRTTILIAHRLSTVRDVDRILVFASGSIVEQGSHDMLINRPGGVYRSLHDTQHRDRLSVA